MTDQQSDEPRELAEVLGFDKRELIVRHVDGDPQAFPELVQLYRKKVYTYLVRFGIPDSTRDDLFQEVFIKIHKAAASYDPAKPLTPWIFTIVANTARTHYRKQKVRNFLTTEKGAQSKEPVTHEGAQEFAVAQETAAWLTQAIHKLPEKQREVVLLSCIKHLDQNEVAKALNIPVNTVKTHLRRARLSLARSLAARKARLKREVGS